MKTIAETLAQVKTYAVMEGMVGPLLDSLRPLRADPHILFVEPWLEEALDGAPRRTMAELHQMLVASTVPGDLVVTHGVVALWVAARCKAMGRRVALVVSSERAAETKAELAKHWPTREQPRLTMEGLRRAMTDLEREAPRRAREAHEGAQYLAARVMEWHDRATAGIRFDEKGMIGGAEKSCS